jgi:DNA-binding SARP family transcriptional activator
MCKFELFLFGSPRFHYQGKAIDLKLRKAMAILIYLAITKGQISRDELATMMWPESSQSRARASLRRTLYTLNKTIGVEILLVDTDTICLDPQVNLSIDVENFKQWTRECSPEADQIGALNSHCLSVLENAVALYQGDFLAGFSLPDSPAFDEWQFFESESLRSSLATALQQLIFTYKDQDGTSQAIEHARCWLSLDPLHEPAHR